MKYLDAGATFSPGREFRYDLWRIWDPDREIINFVGLNPSTANEDNDDPTIRRCVGFAQRWGYGGMHMLNMFTYVTPSPAELVLHYPTPECPDSDKYLRVLWHVVACWGSWSHWVIRGRSVVVRSMLRHAQVFGLNKDGQPKHPLYLPYSTELKPWRLL